MEDRTAAMRDRGLAALVLVCTNAREEHACCGSARGGAVADAARDWLRERDLYWTRAAVAETSCLGMCNDAGAGIVLQPRDEWYGQVTPEEVPELLSDAFGDEGQRLPEPTTDASA